MKPSTHMLQPRLWLRLQQTTRFSQCLQYLAHRLYTTEIVPAKDDDTVRSSSTPDAEQVRLLSESKAGNLDYEPVVMRTYKPRTPGVRHLKRPVNDHLYMGRAHIPLTFARKGQHIGGRNHTGKIVVRHRGGGHKRRIRVVDFDRLESGKHLVERIEHDPGRSAHVALLSRAKNLGEMDDDTKQATVGDGITRVKKMPNDRKYSYIIAPQGMRVGEFVESYRKGIPQKLLDELGGSADAGIIAARTAWRGNCLPLHMIPTGTIIYNIGLYQGKGAQLCRAAGTHAVILGKTDKTDEMSRFINVRLQSGEVRRIHRDACATVGVSSNLGHNQAQLGKAGRSRWLGIRPTVRGVAMNACDHPHGGGRGKSKGNRQTVSIWGQLTKGGYKTRKRKNVNKYVVHARPRSQGTKVKKQKKLRKKLEKNK